MTLELLRKAAESIRLGEEEEAIRLLSKAILRLKTPVQRLPRWVVKGAQVQWTGEGDHTVYVVVGVYRTRGKPWTFIGESITDPHSRMIFRQERGRRYWRKYVAPTGRSDASR